MQKDGCCAQKTDFHRKSHITIILTLFMALLFCHRLAAAPKTPYNPQGNLTRQARVNRLAERSRKRKENAKAIAAAHNRPMKWQVGSKLYEIMAIENNQLYVYTTYNADAAALSGVDLIRNIPPYDLNGVGETVGIWDGGGVRTTHQEFGSRVTIKDGASLHWHSTHVGGTIAAAGVVPSAIGMAPAVTVDSYEWTSDLSEMASRAMSSPREPGKIQISNHSYGYGVGWDAGPVWYGTWGSRESDLFGMYDSEVAQWDSLCYDYPYFLPFKSAGNDRNDDAPSQGTSFQYYDNGWQTKNYNSAQDPYDDGYDMGGFDTIPLNGNAKNIMTVGAVEDNASMSPFSCWGPTDDGRIKPDIVANGVGLYSTLDDSDTSYGWSSGTSMSSPAAVGATMLLVQYYNQLYPSQSMRASSIKALLIHTADDLGNPGPDYSNGWGLIDAKEAADVIGDTVQERIKEGTLNVANPTETYSISLNTSDPARVTLCWTDPAAAASSGLDNTSPRLINDLDLRVTDPDGSTVYYPYVLNPANPANNATTGDNTLDNVEQVMIPSPRTAGSYTVQVTHKASLTNGTQNFSLIVDGSPPTPPTAVSQALTSRAGQPLVISLQADDDGLPMPLEFIIDSLPENATLSDSLGPISPGMLPYTLPGNANEVTYTPNPCYSSTDQFQFMATDQGTSPTGGPSNTATVSVRLYSQLQTQILNADFETGLPPEWTIIDGLSDNKTWIDTNPGGRTSPQWTGTFMIVDSDYAGLVTMDEQLITQSIDCTKYENVILTFNHYFVYWKNEIADVDVSINAGPWQNVARYELADTAGTVELDLSSFADRQSDLRVRFHYYNAYYEWYWGIDDVILTADTAGPPFPADFNFDCGVDNLDLSWFASQWLNTVCDLGNDYCSGADFEPDGNVDFIDFSHFAPYWQN